MPKIPAFRRWRQKDQIMKTSLNYIVSLRAVWNTRNPIVKKKNVRAGVEIKEKMMVMFTRSLATWMTQDLLI